MKRGTKSEKLMVKDALREAVLYHGGIGTKGWREVSPIGVRAVCQDGYIIDLAAEYDFNDETWHYMDYSYYIWERDRRPQPAYVGQFLDDEVEGSV